MVTIRLHNSRTRRKEDFAPLDPGNVRMYVCGPTVYDRAHLGNARPVVVFDVLLRLLRHVYGPKHVTYVRNFTDVDDKINARARAMQGAGDRRDLNAIIRTLTDETIAWYHADMDALGALRPTHEPRATEYIGAMIAMIEALIARGCAYEAEGHVLFEVRRFAAYGALSGRSLDDMIAGARVEVAPFKRDAMDFVLWKPSADDEPGWPSPWGRGRPGWHIECSAMSHALLGAAFDIHGGGLDLQFPHHENEIAQSRCAHPEGDFARFWLHNEMVQVEGKKMSKSLGNFFTVRDLIEDYDREFAIENIGPAIRLRLLEAHYRAPVDSSKSHIEACATRIDGWMNALCWFEDLLQHPWSDHQLPCTSPVLAALCDDLNTPQAIAEIDALCAKLKKLPASGGVINDLADEWQQTARHVLAALHLLGFDQAGVESVRHSNWSRRLQQRRLEGADQIRAKIERLIEARRDARKIRDFARADMLRIGLAEAGVILKDTTAGTEWELSQSFDPAKLETLQ